MTADVFHAIIQEWEGGTTNKAEIARRTGQTRSMVQRALQKYEAGMGVAQATDAGRDSPVGVCVGDDRVRVLGKVDALLKCLKSRKDRIATTTELAREIGESPEFVAECLDIFLKTGYNIYRDGDHVALLVQDVSSVDSDRLAVKTSGDILFGVVSDTHLGCKAERLDALDACYDWFTDEGVKDVYHAGNIIEGDARFNVTERYVHGLDNQVENLLAKYPARRGIVTHFITGDDHEGWAQKDMGISVGRHIEHMAVEAGRKDLHYIGFLEADIAFQNRAGEFVMKVAHPGGGSSYALSYTPQKIVESFGPNEKPGLLIIGHYHKLEYLPHLRGVHVIQAGCFMDQTVFLRKKRISCHVGGWLVRIAQCPNTGAIQRLKAECMAFFDRGFHQNFDRY